MLNKEEKLAKQLLRKEANNHSSKSKHYYSAEEIYNDEKQSFIDKIKKASSSQIKNLQTDNEIDEKLPYSMASDLIDIVKIENGVIYTSDDRYLRIVEVYPINFLLKGIEDQTSIIRNFQKYLRIAPAKMQIKSIATKADVSKITDAIDMHIKEERLCPVCGKAPEKHGQKRCERCGHVFNWKSIDLCNDMQQDYKTLVKTTGLSEGITRRFFIIIEYERRSDRACNQREIETTLSSACNNIVTYLKGCGNKVNFPQGPDATNDTVRFIYDILNRDRATEDDYISHLNDVCWWYEDNYGDDVEFSPAEYVAPEEVFFGKDYTVINDTYYDFITLRSDDIPVEVPGGWLSFLVNAGSGIDVDIYIQREDKSKMLSRIERKVKITASATYGQTAETKENDNMHTELESGRFIRSRLSGSGEEFFYTNIMITISSPTLESLLYKKNSLKNFLKARDMKAFDCTFLQEQAFVSYLPLCKIDKTLYNRSLRNVLTTGLSSYYPFTSFELCDPDGIYLGTNEMNDSLAILDLFNSHVYKNANMAIVGVTGAGKTYLLQLLTMRFRRNGIQTFIIAPDKGHEFKRGCDALGGEFISIAPSSTQCINVMEIRKKDNNAKEKLKMLIEESELAQKIETLHIFFKLLLPDITYEEDQLLDEAIMNTYERYGITTDNASLDNGHGGYKKMPILGDLHDELLKNPAASRVANILSRMVYGSAKGFNNQTNVDLSNKYVILDISSLGKSTLLPAVCLLSSIWCIP